MSTVDQRVLARAAAGKRAREEAQAIDRLVESMRLASFRSYLAATVNSMSAIVPDVLAMVGSDVGSALQRIRPGYRWPSTTVARKAVVRSHIARPLRHGSASPSFADPRAASYFAPLIGDAIISDGSPGDWSEAMILGDSLDVVLRSDGYELSTRAGIACLKMASSLPATVIAVCEGRPLVEIVDHPLLRSGGFVIERAAQVKNCSVLSFNVGQVSLEVPWRP